jgi:hypothetical protein
VIPRNAAQPQPGGTFCQSYKANSRLARDAGSGCHRELRIGLAGTIPAINEASECALETSLAEIPPR